MKKLFPSTIFVAALLLLLVMSGRAAVADEIQIKDVDNYAGNSNVYTDKPNTSVTISELGYNGDVVNSWTGTTDAKGKITIPAGHNLSKPYLRARYASGNQSGTIEGIVVPDSLSAGQPFSFSVPQSAGTAVNVQTITGEVVQHATTDRYGRVFLSAGLSAGAYLISPASGGPRAPIGEIVVGQRAKDALQRPWEHPGQPMQIHDAPQLMKCSERFSLAGQGFSPNYADMQVSLSGAGQTSVAPVLAATEDQLKLAPGSQAQPGLATLTVTNKATGEGTDPTQVLLYDLQARMDRRTLNSGRDQTQLVVTVRPENLPLQVQAKVISGPVDFGEGRKEAATMTNNGLAIFPVHAERGSGPFQLDWMLATPRTTILPCLINGIKCGTPFFNAASWKLNWLEEMRRTVENDSSLSDEQKKAKLKALDEEKDTILGKDLKKSWETVKANLERRLKTAKDVRAGTTNGEDIVYWNDRIEEIEKLLNDMVKEGPPK